MDSDINIHKMELFLLLLCMAVVAHATTTEEDVEYISKNLVVKFMVLQNVNGNDANFDAQVNLQNEGTRSIMYGDWEIYFNCLYMVEPEHLPNQDGYEIPEIGVKVFHINGGLFKLTPTINFEPILPDKILKVPLTIAAWSVSRTDNMPRWYVTSSDGLVHYNIEHTDTDDLEDFTGDYSSYVKWKRYEQDHYDPWNATDRWDRWTDGFKGQEAKVVIPTPSSVSFVATSTMSLPLSNWQVTYNSDDVLNARNELIQAYPEWDLTSSQGNCDGQQIICLVLNSNFDGTGYDPHELQINPGTEQIRIESNTAAGIYYGVQTMMSLFDGALILGTDISETNIQDGARYEYRGMHVDLARNYVPPEQIQKLIRTMGMYKLNKLHLHLSDDEGWRIEMPWCSELTAIASKRCHDLKEETCIIPQLGSGDSGRTQFLTKETYRNIVTTANEHHVEIIPEIDLPGHMHAAIKATDQHARANNNNTFLLSNTNDTSIYHSIQMYTDNAVEPCQSSTYTFIEMVVKTLVEYHDNLQPLKVIHLGGDEVPESAWMESPLCEDVLGDGFTHNDVKLLFMKRISQLVHDISPDLSLGLWEDGVMNATIPFERSDFKNDQVLTYNWQSIWEWGYGTRPYLLANEGYKVIMSQATHLYFDHPHEPDPEERGLYWGTRYTDTRRTFGFKPDDLYANVETKRSGEPYTKEDMCVEYDCVPLENPENILGIQGQLFSETVRTNEQFDYMVYPRILALAERSWHKAEWEETSNEEEMKVDYEKFAKALGERELKRLEPDNIEYRISVPGVKLNNDAAAIASAEFPGMPIQYALGEDSGEWKQYSNPVDFGDFKTMRFRCSSVDGKRFGRETFINRSGSSATKFYFKLMFIATMTSIMVSEHA